MGVGIMTSNASIDFGDRSGAPFTARPKCSDAVSPRESNHEYTHNPMIMGFKKKDSDLKKHPIFHIFPRRIRRMAVTVICNRLSVKPPEGGSETISEARHGGHG